MCIRDSLEILLNRPKVNAIDLATSRKLGDAFVLLRDDPVSYTHLTLPTNSNDLENSLKSLKISKLFDGFRGGEMIDTEQLVTALLNLVVGVMNSAIGIKEIEINPLFVYKEKVCAVDVLMRIATGTSGAVNNK